MGPWAEFLLEMGLPFLGCSENFFSTFKWFNAKIIGIIRIWLENFGAFLVFGSCDLQRFWPGTEKGFRINLYDVRIKDYNLFNHKYVLILLELTSNSSNRSQGRRNRPSRGFPSNFQIQKTYHASTLVAVSKDLLWTMGMPWWKSVPAYLGHLMVQIIALSFLVELNDDQSTSWVLKPAMFCQLIQNHWWIYCVKILLIRTRNKDKHYLG